MPWFVIVGPGRQDVDYGPFTSMADAVAALDDAEDRWRAQWIDEATAGSIVFQRVNCRILIRRTRQAVERVLRDSKAAISTGRGHKLMPTYLVHWDGRIYPKMPRVPAHIKRVLARAA